MTQERACWLGACTHPAPIGTGRGGPAREGSGSAGLLSSSKKIYYTRLEVHVKIPCLRWPLPPPSLTLAQWPDGLTVPTVHRAKKQPAHLPFVPYPQTSGPDNENPAQIFVGLVLQWPDVICPYRADWEPAASSGKSMAGVPGVFWRSPVVFWGLSAQNPALVSGKPHTSKN